MIYFIIFWVIGFIPHYLLYKKWWRMQHEWTVGDRKFVLALIWTSWLGCIASIICILIQGNPANNHKKAKW